MNEYIVNTITGEVTHCDGVTYSTLPSGNCPYPELDDNTCWIDLPKRILHRHKPSPFVVKSYHGVEVHVCRACGKDIVPGKRGGWRKYKR